MLEYTDDFKKRMEIADIIVDSIRGEFPIVGLELRLNGSVISLQDFLMEDTSILGQELAGLAEEMCYAVDYNGIYEILASTPVGQEVRSDMSREECAAAVRRFSMYTWNHTPSVRDAYVSAYKHARNMIRGTIELSEGLALSSSLSKLVRDANVKTARPISARALKEMIPEIRDVETSYAKLIPKSRLSPLLDFVMPKRVVERQKDMREVSSYLKQKAERVIPRLQSFGHEYRNWYLTQHDHGVCDYAGKCPRDRHLNK